MKKVFLREKGEIFEIKNFEEKEFEKDYKILLGDDIVFIDKDIKKLKPYVKYLLNSKQEDLKDLFITFILFLSILSVIFGFFNYNKINKIQKLTFERNKIVEEIKNKKTTKKEIEESKTPYNNLEQNIEIKRIKISEANGGGGAR